MSQPKRVLVIGGTGAMGRYTVAELLAKGYRVDVVSLDNLPSDNPSLRYFVGPGKSIRYIGNLLENEKYDGVIDYMIYSTSEFAERYRLFLENTGHYIFLSTYRIYADDRVITENSPRLLDVSRDEKFLASEDYSLFKARCENILTGSKYTNWTIVRPSVTYSVKRYQLVTWEANVLIPRTLAKKKIVLPEEAMGVESCMTWAGDTGKMFAGLLFNEKALCETFTLATAEHHPWQYVADCYTELIGSRFEMVDRETFLQIRSPSADGKIDNGTRWQLELDRLFNRVVDNTKVLSVTGLSQSDFTPLKEGLRKVLSAVKLDEIDWNSPAAVNEKTDAYLSGR